MPTKCEDCEKYYESEWLEPICRAYGIILPASHKDKPYCHLSDDTEFKERRHRMRLIDADAAIKAIANCAIYGADEIKTQCEKSIYEENGWLGGLKDAIEAVEDMPTEVKIIRCRDCVYRELDADLGGFDWCNAWHEPTHEGGFCHLARMVSGGTT